MDIKIALSLCLIVLLGEKCLGWNLHFGYNHGGNSEYIHSNDTMRLTLEKNTLLKVEPNSRHELRFMLENFGSDGHFSISHMSEDNLRGLLQNTEEYLSRGQSATITISNIQIPDVPIGTKVSISLTAERDTRNKRSAQGQGGGFGGQGGSMGGQGQRIPNNGGNGYFPNNGGNNFINWNDPSLRREITLTVEFTIVDSDDADSREKHHPWIEAEFAAQSREDSCHDTSSSFCEDKWWWVQFTTADYKHGSGIRSIDMDKSRSTNGGRRPDADINGEQVYYRYKNFVVGSDDEIEVVAGTSCCNEHMRILVEDVDGNVEEMSVKSTHYGSLKYCDYCLGLSLGAFWGIIVGVVVVLIIVIVLISYFCCCKKSCAGYSAANTN